MRKFFKLGSEKPWDADPEDPRSGIGVLLVRGGESSTAPFEPIRAGLGILIGETVFYVEVLR